MNPLPPPSGASPRRTLRPLAPFALALPVLAAACGDVPAERALSRAELRAGLAAVETPALHLRHVEGLELDPSSEVVFVGADEADAREAPRADPVESEPVEPVDATSDRPATWQGRRPADLRVRLYARTADEADQGAQTLALRLESLGFAVEVVAPRSWRPARETTWLGERTLDEVLGSGEAGLVLMPPSSNSAGDLLRDELGKLYRLVGRGTETRQHEHEQGVDTLIDVLPRPGALRQP